MASHGFRDYNEWVRASAKADCQRLTTESLRQCFGCGYAALCNSQVSSCHCCFGACSAFTHVMACTLAESPSDPLHRKLRQLRCLPRRFECYRVERTSSRAGTAPAEVQRLSRCTFSPTTNPVSGYQRGIPS